MDYFNLMLENIGSMFIVNYKRTYSHLKNPNIMYLFYLLFLHLAEHNYRERLINCNMIFLRREINVKITNNELSECFYSTKKIVKGND